MLFSGDTNSSGQKGLWFQLCEVSSPFRRVDLIILALMLTFGAFHFFFSKSANDFSRDDVFYADCARSLIHQHFYGINGHPETNQPPGLPAALALLCLLGGCTYTAFQHAMPVFEVLGFLAAYELLRRHVPRGVAAAICLLLLSSEVYFSSATRSVVPSFPYFFSTMCALLVADQLEKSTRLFARIAWGALLAFLVAASLMFASAAIALLGAIVASTAMLLFRDRQLAFARFKTYLAVLLLGLAVQAVWMHRKPAPLEWPLPGYPQSYVSQLKLKSGNYPELGMATLGDIPPRIQKNVIDHSGLLSRILLRRWIGDAWMSIVILGPLLCVALGWSYSVWLTGGGLLEWYFAGYEFIYLLWPWDLERRFFLPIAPLACLYLWRGLEAVILLAKNKPRLLGLVWLPVAVFLSICTWLWMHGSPLVGYRLHSGLQDEVSFSLWLSSGMLALWMALAPRSWSRSVSALANWYAKPLAGGPLTPLRFAQALCTVLFIALIVIGLRIQLEIGNTNRGQNASMDLLSPDVEAASWIRLHSGPSAIVMARHVPTAYHFSERKVVWFPPSSDAHLLMNGIAKYKVGFLVVVNRENSYYLPSDEDCFASLIAAYPGNFRLAYQTPSLRIFEVSLSSEP
jgi:hypothetical protein